MSMPKNAILVDANTLAKYNVWIRNLKRILWVAFAVSLLAILVMAAVDPFGSLSFEGSWFIVCSMSTIVVILLIILNIIESLRYRKFNGRTRKSVLLCQIVLGHIMVFIVPYVYFMMILAAYELFFSPPPIGGAL